MAEEERDSPDRDGSIGAVARAVRLLEHLGNSSRPQSLRELSEIAGTSDSTVYRILATLGKFNLVERDPVTRRFGVGPGIARLAEARRRHFDILTVARPHLEGMRDRTLETTSLYTVGNDAAVCIDRVDGTLEVRRIISVGTVVPMPTLGAIGKGLMAHLPPQRQLAMLNGIDWSKALRKRSEIEAELPEIRRKGVARSFGERAFDIASLAAMIFNERNQLAWLIIITGPLTRWDGASMDKVEDALVAAARDISREMGSTLDFHTGRRARKAELT